jgi:hypothetical protein
LAAGRDFGRTSPRIVSDNPHLSIRCLIREFSLRYSSQSYTQLVSFALMVEVVHIDLSMLYQRPPGLMGLTWLIDPIIRMPTQAYIGLHQLEYHVQGSDCSGSHDRMSTSVAGHPPRAS